jgi:hypothetical protein
MKTLGLIVLIWAVLADYVGAGGEHRSLGIAEAIRIAATKARSEGYDVSRYEAPLVRYKSTDDATGSWWVNYRRKNHRYTEFSIQVEDRTKKASLFLP